MLLRYFLLCLSLLPVLHGAEVDDLMRQAAVAEARQDSRAALELWEKADKLQPDYAQILQKIARQYSDLVEEQKDVATKKKFAQTALKYSERAVKLNPEDPVNILSLAVCHGRLAVYSETREKVRYSRLVREEAERALRLDPNYAWAHHLLGRWHYEMADLSGTTRFFARLFYGELPTASVREGIDHLRQATALEPQEMNHWLELGFAYSAGGNSTEARAHWEHGLAMPSRGSHDEAAKQRVRRALAEAAERQP